MVPKYMKSSLPFSFLWRMSINTISYLGFRFNAAVEACTQNKGLIPIFDAAEFVIQLSLLIRAYFVPAKVTKNSSRIRRDNCISPIMNSRMTLKNICHPMYVSVFHVANGKLIKTTIL